MLYPSNQTVLLQHLQTLVIRGNANWIGGVLPSQKLERLVLKLSKLYPFMRDERGRTYDRSRGKASVHFVVYPTADGWVAWWMLTSAGKGGLADPASPDASVAKNALAADGHIEFGDYVLLYAHKKDARTVKDARTGKEKRILKDCSTWTWKLRPAVLSELRAKLAAEVTALNYGDDKSARPWGVRGFLLYQRRRPLFSGVRTQVLGLHREAIDLWEGVRKRWLGKYPKLAMQYGDKAGQLIPLGVITKEHLPKMPRLKVFTDKSKTLATLSALPARRDAES